MGCFRVGKPLGLRRCSVYFRAVRVSSLAVVRFSPVCYIPTLPRRHSFSGADYPTREKQTDAVAPLDFKARRA